MRKEDVKRISNEFSLDLSPFIVYMELTKACDLVCFHCRAEAKPYPDKGELSTEEVFNLINNIKDFCNPPPTIVFTGGDPLKRTDLFKILQYSIDNSIRTCIAPSVTPLLTDKIVDRFKDIGIARIGISLDGAQAKTHDKIRGIEGAYKRTIDIISYMDKINMSMQINTTVTKVNIRELWDLAELLSQYNMVHMWSVFFLIPTGRGALLEDISASEYEEVFSIIYEVSKKYHYPVKTTEAQHYRRYLLQKQHVETDRTKSDLIGRMPVTNDGYGIIFVSSTGDIYPSGFLPVKCGNVRYVNIVDIYRNHETFLQLRDKKLLKGKCGVCEFKKVCGGSRARSFAYTGDFLESDPKCSYIPAKAISKIL